MRGTDCEAYTAAEKLGTVLTDWTNRFKRLAARLALLKQEFNAVAFYLAMADLIGKECL